MSNLFKRCEKCVAKTRENEIFLVVQHMHRKEERGPGLGIDYDIGARRALPAELTERRKRAARAAEVCAHTVAVAVADKPVPALLKFGELCGREAVAAQKIDLAGRENTRSCRCHAAACQCVGKFYIIGNG